MSYTTVLAMSGSQSLMGRIAVCIAENLDLSATTYTPISWATSNILKLSTSDGWAGAWESAESAKNVNMNPDTGARNDVITDAMILSAVTDLAAEQFG